MENLKLCEKIAKIRKELQESGIKKNGKNTYANFDYFEISDFLPTLNILMEKYSILDNVRILNDVAHLDITDGVDTYSFTIPFKIYDTPLNKQGGKSMQDIQYLGALITYTRRYLYQNAFGITDGDVINSMNQVDTPPAKTDTPESNKSKTSKGYQGNKKPKTADEYIIDFGRYKGITLIDLINGDNEQRKYVHYLEDKGDDLIKSLIADQKTKIQEENTQIDQASYYSYNIGTGKID